VRAVLQSGGEPNEAQREHIDRFVAAFVLKKGTPPAGHWKVPGVGYVIFIKKVLEK
jgi:hypothetical protein